LSFLGDEDYMEKVTYQTGVKTVRDLVRIMKKIKIFHKNKSLSASQYAYWISFVIFELILGATSSGFITPALASILPNNRGSDRPTRSSAR
jgi:hypothetical protein